MVEASSVWGESEDRCTESLGEVPDEGAESFDLFAIKCSESNFIDGASSRR